MGPGTVGRAVRAATAAGSRVAARPETDRYIVQESADDFDPLSDALVRAEPVE